MLRSLSSTMFLVATALVSLLLSACGKPITPVFTSSEPRIWVVRDFTEVYRCVDTAPEGKGPQPVCVQAQRVGREAE